FMSGWVAGIGTEYAITRNFSFRAEYLHVDLGKDTILSYVDDDIRGKLEVEPAYDIVRAGFNYRFDALTPGVALEPAAYLAPPTFNWTGLHVGLNGG
ncbi:hypothetical protein J8J27_25760, partial [Mycobacterium tuberculosis]|nr:hypothetical protein [Mycobacterium tuberculosis]